MPKMLIKGSAAVIFVNSEKYCVQLKVMNFGSNISNSSEKLSDNVDIN
jgi:hypothetical protein